MDGYYISYLKSSDSYTRLVSTISNVNKQIDNITRLYNTFNTASGNNINAIKIDLLDIKKDLTSYNNSLMSIKSQLESNASMFDTTLTTWKGRIGKNYTKPTNKELVSWDIEKQIYTYLTSSEKIDDAYVDSNGHVIVKTKETKINIINDKSNNKTETKLLSEKYYEYKEGFGEETRSGWWDY